MQRRLATDQLIVDGYDDVDLSRARHFNKLMRCCVVEHHLVQLHVKVRMFEGAYGAILSQRLRRSCLGHVSLIDCRATQTKYDE
jgi:hypothetical protein